MAALASVFVEVKADTRTFEPDLRKKLNRVDATASGKQAGSKWGSGFSKAAGAFAAVGILKFGQDSVGAFKDAEVAQARLSDAYAKFPKLADVSIGSLRNYNTELAKKTRFDDDATASGQAVLAQFGLTGKQVKDLTPLLQDYAAKTGKDLPTAAKDLGKAMLGQGKALKAVGINFKDTGTSGGNFNQIMTGLRTQVGGFAEKEGKTATGQTAILTNQFGELQEQVGEGLFPVITTLVGKLLALIGFVQRNKDVIIPLGLAILGVAVVTKAVTAATAAWTAMQKVAAVATKAWAGAQWLINAALTANPIGLIIVGIAALIAIVVVIATKTTWFQTIWGVVWRFITKTARSAWDDFLKPIFDALVTAYRTVATKFGELRDTLATVWTAIKIAVQDAVRYVVLKFLDMAGWVIRAAATAFGWVPGLGEKLKTAADAFKTFRDQVNTALGGVNDQVVNVRVQLGAGKAVVGSGANAIRIEADGGILKRFAAGSERHIAQIARPGEMRLWAEPETGGEAYIPLAGSKRGRSTQILGAVAQRFGYGLVPMAAGGLRISPQVAGQAKFQVALDSYERDIEGFATRVGQAVKKLTGGGNVVEFAKRWAGRIPYVWGGAAPTGADCSGWISVLTNVAKGAKNPWRRLFSTGTLPAGLFAPGPGRFNIGWFAGNPGHMAATINGYPTESRGGDGVVGGARSRGAGQSMFNRHAHLIGYGSGGIRLPGDPPFDLLDPRGKHYRPGLLDALKEAKVADRGAWLPPRSRTVVENGTSQWEPVGPPGGNEELLAELRGLRADLARQPSATGREVGAVLVKGIRR